LIFVPVAHGQHTDLHDIGYPKCYLIASASNFTLIISQFEMSHTYDGMTGEQEEDCISLCMEYLFVQQRVNIDPTPIFNIPSRRNPMKSVYTRLSSAHRSLPKVAR
jgi:hypothetical protein